MVWHTPFRFVAKGDTLIDQDLSTYPTPEAVQSAKAARAPSSEHGSGLGKLIA